MSTDSREPIEVASPMGKRLSGKYAEARKAPGIRTKRIAMLLCRKESPDFPQAQKYPLKQK